MTKSREEILDMAAECRELAHVAKSDTMREQLLEIAEQFERLANDQLEKLRRPHLISLH